MLKYIPFFCLPEPNQKILICPYWPFNTFLLFFNFEKAGLRLIRQWMTSFFSRPKNGTHEALEEYKKAEKIGEEQGDCWSFYPECPISIFNVIPDVYTTDDQVEVSFDGFDSGSKFDNSNDTSEVRYFKLNLTGIHPKLKQFGFRVGSGKYQGQVFDHDFTSWS